MVVPSITRFPFTPRHGMDPRPILNHLVSDSGRQRRPPCATHVPPTREKQNDQRRENECLETKVVMEWDKEYQRYDIGKSAPENDASTSPVQREPPIGRLTFEFPRIWTGTPNAPIRTRENRPD